MEEANGVYVSIAQQWKRGNKIQTRAKATMIIPQSTAVCTSCNIAFKIARVECFTVVQDLLSAVHA